MQPVVLVGDAAVVAQLGEGDECHFWGRVFVQLFVIVVVIVGVLVVGLGSIGGIIAVFVLQLVVIFGVGPFGLLLGWSCTSSLGGAWLLI